MKRALLIVDPLRDFCPGGSLAAPEGAAIMPRINELERSGRYDLVVLINEVHPPGHISFASRHGEEEFQEITLENGQKQMMWPDHCVEGTRGCKPHPDLDLEPVDETIYKGCRREVEDYSGFEDQDGEPTGLDDILRQHGIEGLDVVGIATDYCVKATVLHARREDRRYPTRVIQDACAGIEANAGDVEGAKQAMQEAGAEIVDAQRVLR
jgi:nicotinamidase/pyrazinamidase